MEDIDKFIADFKMQQEIQDYVEKDIYPPSLQVKYRKPDYKPEPLKPFIEPSTIPDPISPSKNINTLHDCIRQCKHLEEIIKKYQQEEKTTCPICFENIGPVDYFMPTCGHKVCRCCAMQNLQNNKNTGSMCSLCRTQIF